MESPFLDERPSVKGKAVSAMVSLQKELPHKDEENGKVNRKGFGTFPPNLDNDEEVRSGLAVETRHKSTSKLDRMEINEKFP